MPEKFNPNHFKGKNTVYIVDNKYPGICSVWDWDANRKRYIQRQNGLRYHCYKKINGRQYSKSFENFDEAKKWRSSLELFGVSKDAPKTTFKEIAEKFFEHKKNRVQPTTLQTMIAKSKHLEFFNSLPMAQINHGAIDAWLEALKKKSYLDSQHSSRTTYRHELSILRQILTYYSEYLDDSYQVPLKKRHLEDAVVDPIRLREAKARNSSKFLTRDQCQAWIEHLFKSLQEDESKVVFAYLAHFQFNTGTRIGEACALEWKDVDSDLRSFRVSKTVQWARAKDRETVISNLTKTGESRVVPIIDIVKEGLARWQKVSGRSKGLIFSLNGFRPLEYRAIQYQYNKGFNALGLQASSTHILRHSFATDFLRETHNQLALSKVLGHSSLKQTEHYAKITSITTETGVGSYNKALLDKKVLSIDRSKESDFKGLSWEGLGEKEA